MNGGELDEQRREEERQAGGQRAGGRELAERISESERRMTGQATE